MKCSLDAPIAGQRILLLGVDLGGGGGVNKVIRDLSEIFTDTLGLRTTVTSARSNRQPTYAFPSGVSLEFAPRPGGGRCAYISYLLTLRRRRFDYAVGFWTQDNILLALALAFSGTHIILCEHIPHDYAPRHVRLLRRLIYPWAWAVTVLNRTDLSYYSRFLSRVMLVPNPVDVGEPPPVGKREKLIIGVGHLIPLKGFDDLLRAWSLTLLPAQGWRLALIGEGPEHERLAALAANLELTGVDFVPPTPEIQSWYRRASLIVVPSRVEAFSLVLAEAVAAGVIPAAYAAPGPAYLLEDFPDHLVSIGDYRGLAGLLTRLASHDKPHDLVAAIAKSLGQRLAPERVAEKWRALFSGFAA